MSDAEEKKVLYALLAELLKKQVSKSKKKAAPKADDILSKALSRAANRMLPGARLVRSGRPMTDMLAKIRKSQRRALNSAYFKYRGKVVKGPKKALITETRKNVSKSYKKK